VAAVEIFSAASKFEDDNVAHFESTAGRTLHGARISVSKVSVLAINILLWSGLLLAAKAIFG
jgi:hypothetical protein